MQLSMQEYFDKTIRHLAQQNGRAMMGAMCAYLDDQGRKCAVGCHMPDGHPAQNFGGDIGVMLYDYPDLKNVVIPVDEGPGSGYDLAYSLQKLHDNAANWITVKFIGFRNAKEIAENFGLDPSVAVELANKDKTVLPIV